MTARTTAGRSLVTIHGTPTNSMLSSLSTLPAILGQNEAYVGFTSATGNALGSMT